MTEAVQNFTVHLFIDHNPFLASVFFPELFRDLRDDAWKLPTQFPLPARQIPAAPTIEGDHIDIPRVDLPNSNQPEALGRHILPSLPASTTLKDLATLVADSYGIREDQQALFCLYPTNYGRYDDKYWAEKKLFSEVSLIDVKQAEPLKDPENEPEDSPEGDPSTIYLVLETKASAINRLVGSSYLITELGTPYQMYRDAWNRYDAFSLDWGPSASEFPDLIKALRKWRHASHAIEYLNRNPPFESAQSAGPSSERHRKELERLGTLRRESLDNIATGVRQWHLWINGDGQQASQALNDENIEEALLEMWQQQYGLIEEWKSSDRMPALRSELLAHYERVNPHQKLIDDFYEAQRLRYQQDYEEENSERADPQGESAEPFVPPETSVVAKPFRNADGSISLAHAHFDITSGTLLWGQTLPLYHGSLSERFTNSPGNPRLRQDPLSGGTIIQRVYTYRSAARTGRWLVRRFYSNWKILQNFGKEPSDHAGWIIYHADVDPEEVIAKARCITGSENAISNSNDHIDKDVLYINRYDWGQHWHNPEDEHFEEHFQAYAGPVIGPPTRKGLSSWSRTPKLNMTSGFHLVALDAEQWGLDFINAYKHSGEEAAGPIVEKTFQDKDGMAFGTYVRMEPEYELAWLVYSGKKHETHNADELIAIIYDASYEQLEGIRHRVES